MISPDPPSPTPDPDAPPGTPHAADPLAGVQAGPEQAPPPAAPDQTGEDSGGDNGQTRPDQTRPDRAFKSKRLSERRKRQHLFAHLYVFGSDGVAGNAGRAYAIAYDRGDWDDLDQIERTRVRRSAYSALRAKYVKDQIKRHQSTLATATGMTRASWIQDAIRLRNLAAKDRSHVAARGYHRDIGEALGHFVHRIEVSHQVESGELMKELKQLMAEHPGLAEYVQADMKVVENTADKPTLTLPEKVSENV